MIGHLSMPPKSLTLIFVLFRGLDMTYSLESLSYTLFFQKSFFLLTQVSQSPFPLISIK